ncbi:hypothetical protein Micbo1qcDRAFT_209798 [Microdochium bolleyi]|uniref:CFEM domain-containing protein n=1 Tax=Microdochium bolleyi TaxID=196109 RepID=A0A136IKZ3_9PEZI|nr:hypothetical protein Micbo1qcDRAFT_209798 [Microdochium bolleyi]
MKAVLVISALFAAVLAQNLPSCAQTCVNQLTQNNQIAGCAQADAACICRNNSQFACCLSRTCSKADQDASVSYANNLCVKNGVAVPSSVVCRG